MKTAATILFLLALLLSCHQKADQITEVNGEVNAKEIAADTTRQKAIENTYEYSKTLVVDNRLSYLIYAYGERNKGKYLIIRQTPGKNDTVMKGNRYIIFKDALLIHPDKKYKGKIIIVPQTDSTKQAYPLIFRINKQNDLLPLEEQE